MKIDKNEHEMIAGSRFNSDAIQAGSSVDAVYDGPNGAISATNSHDTDLVPSTTLPIRAQNSPRMLDEAIRSISDHERQLERHEFPSTNMHVSTDRLIAGDHEYYLPAAGFQRLCHRLGAPADYLRRLSTPLYSQLIAFHLAEGTFSTPGLAPDNSVIVSRGGEFVDLVRNDLYRLDTTDVLTSVSDGIGSGAADLEIKLLTVADEAFVLDLVSPRIHEEVRRGDIVQGGIRVEHSLLSEFATTISAYMFRLVCRNGMVHRECVHYRKAPRTRRLDRNRANARDLQRTQIRRLTAEAWDGLRPKLTAIRNLQRQTVDVQSLLDQFLRRGRLHSHRMLSLSQRAWEMEGSEPTAFGVFNALTRLATHATELSQRQRRMLAHLAGIFAMRDTHICPHCFSVLTAGPHPSTETGPSAPALAAAE